MQAEAGIRATVAALIPGNLIFFPGICEAGDTGTFMGTALFLKPVKIPHFCSCMPRF